MKRKARIYWAVVEHALPDSEPLVVAPFPNKKAATKEAVKLKKRHKNLTFWVVRTYF